MNHTAVLLLSVAAFAALALAMERHQQDLFGRPLAAARTRALRLAGWLLLGLSLAVAVRTGGWGLGLVAWVGHIALAAGAVLLGLFVAGSRLFKKL